MRPALIDQSGEFLVGVVGFIETPGCDLLDEQCFDREPPVGEGVAAVDDRKDGVTVQDQCPVSAWDQLPVSGAIAFDVDVEMYVAVCCCFA